VLLFFLPLLWHHCLITFHCYNSVMLEWPDPFSLCEGVAAYGGQLWKFLTYFPNISHSFSCLFLNYFPLLHCLSRYSSVTLPITQLPSQSFLISQLVSQLASQILPVSQLVFWLFSTEWWRITNVGMAVRLQSSSIQEVFLNNVVLYCLRYYQMPVSDPPIWVEAQETWFKVIKSGQRHYVHCGSVIHSFKR